MRTVLRQIAWMVSGAALSCGASLPHPPYMAQSTAALTPIPLPPPPARVEVVPPSPAKGATWIDGEWIYKHGRWAWSLGEWVIPPEGAFFSPWTIVRSADGALLHAPGVWRDAKGVVIAPPPPLALAVAEMGPVVDAEGVTETTGRTVKPGGLPTSPEGEVAADAGPAEAGQPAK